MASFDQFRGELVIVKEVTGSILEGVWDGSEQGMIPKCFVKGCREVNVQDAREHEKDRKKKLSCEWWEVGDVVLNEHHIVRVQRSNLVPRER